MDTHATTHPVTHAETFTTEDGLTMDAFSAKCPSRAELRTVTGRWAPLVILALADGITRFGDLHRYVEGSSERMIAQTLQGLADAEVAARSVDADGRPRYELTPGGKQIAERLRGLMDAVYTHLGDRLR